MSNTNATCDGSCKLDVTPMGDACLEVRPLRCSRASALSAQHPLPDALQGQDTYCTVKYYSPANGHEHTVYAEFSLTTATCIPHDCGRDDKHALARHMAAEFCNLSGSLAPLFGSYCAVHLSCNYGLSGTDIAIIVSCSVVGVLGTVGCCLWWKRRKTNHTATSGDYDPLLALEEDELPGNDVLLQHNESGL